MGAFFNVDVLRCLPGALSAIDPENGAKAGIRQLAEKED